MGNTLRKDRNDKVFKESLKKKDGHYRCKCSYCTGVDLNEVKNKIAEKEMKEEIVGITIEYNTIEEIKSLIKSIPNDSELGRAVRELFS